MNGYEIVGFGGGGFGGFDPNLENTPNPQITLQFNDDFKRYQPGLAPPWLLGPRGASLLESEGVLKDWISARAVAASKSHLALAAPWDALGRIGSMTGLPRWPLESMETYRTRLTRAFDIHRMRGTSIGLRDQLEGIGFGAVILEHVRWQRDIWAEFSVWLSPGTSSLSAGDTTTIRGLLDLINRWKPAHARLHGCWYGPSSSRWWEDAAGPWWDTVPNTWNASSVITLQTPLTS